MRVKQDLGHSKKGRVVAIYSKNRLDFLQFDCNGDMNKFLKLMSKILNKFDNMPLYLKCNAVRQKLPYKNSISTKPNIPIYRMSVSKTKIFSCILNLVMLNHSKIFEEKSKRNWMLAMSRVTEAGRSKVGIRTMQSEE